MGGRMEDDMTRMLCLAVLVVASCGTDGTPLRPRAIGTVSVSNHGVETEGSVEATNGRITIGVGF